MNRIKLLLSLVILVVASVSLGADLIEGPERVDAYKFIDVKVTGEWESAIWEVAPDGKADLRPSADGKTMTFVAPPGVYTVRAVVVNFTKKTLSQGKRVITIGEGKSPDPPVPPPPPSPGKASWIGVIYESADATPASVVVRDAKAWKDSASSLGIKWIVIDKDESVKSFPEATKRAIAAGLPAVVSIGKDGVCTAEKLPATVDAMVTLVKEKGGAK